MKVDFSRKEYTDAQRTASARQSKRDKRFQKKFIELMRIYEQPMFQYKPVLSPQDVLKKDRKHG